MIENDILLDGFTRVYDSLHRTLKDLTETELIEEPHAHRLARLAAHPSHGQQCFSAHRPEPVPGYHSCYEHAQRKILVPMNELEIVLVIRQECRPDPAGAERNENVVQKGRQL